jgi:hypothetical protein
LQKELLRGPLNEAKAEGKNECQLQEASGPKRNLKERSRKLDKTANLVTHWPLLAEIRYSNGRNSLLTILAARQITQ